MLEQACIAGEQAFELLRPQKEAVRAAREEENERVLLKKVEMDRIAAEGRERERRCRDKAKALVEAEEHLHKSQRGEREDSYHGSPTKRKSFDAKGQRIE